MNTAGRVGRPASPHTQSAVNSLPEVLNVPFEAHAARALAKIEFVDIEILDPGDDPMGMGEFKEEVH